MFLFIIARTPIAYRTPLREELWRLCKQSLHRQTSENWKAIIVGDTENEQLDSNFFITLTFDNYNKVDKINKALNYIELSSQFSPEYLIRLDDDDIFSENILSEIERLPEKYDCYFDDYHTYIDPVYLKISHVKNWWIPNTAIHKYNHALIVCGPEQIPLITQDHSSYWHIYYQDKKVHRFNINNVLYYRILSPYSITSSIHQVKGIVNWPKYLNYLKGYGPWVSLPKKTFYFDLQTISYVYFSDKPKLSNLYWAFNKLKFFNKRFFK